ncbi:hypothetical protein SLEP1_g51982 [Rubroshorea leprosula]|uniref:Uncharacterized protein n=1 Tax=Rubroshorea leprosula TaxID=152421 RepID=A0AAV5M6K3_9ROSI|nr:hypothetical protein SLEP1_g51982 [Rubroshorea leprosula]
MSAAPVQRIWAEARGSGAEEGWRGAELEIDADSVQGRCRKQGRCRAEAQVRGRVQARCRQARV